MKKSILPLALILLLFTLRSVSAAPQDVDRRVDVSRAAVDESRTYRGDHRDSDRHDSRAAEEIERLQREVRHMRNAIGNSRAASHRLRERFHRVVRATDNLNDQFRNGSLRGWEVRRRADEIRVDLEAIRRDLRGRAIGVGGWR